jgi:hypothetical protein
MSGLTVNRLIGVRPKAKVGSPGLWPLLESSDDDLPPPSPPVRRRDPLPFRYARVRRRCGAAGGRRLARPDAANAARDGARHPYESLVFWGLKPKQTVIEVSPGGGYWTEILAPYAKATGGTYVAGLADLANPKISEGAARAGRTSRCASWTRPSTGPCGS